VSGASTVGDPASKRHRQPERGQDLHSRPLRGGIGGVGGGPHPERCFRGDRRPSL